MLHHARTVCRRAEMEVVRVIDTQRSGVAPMEVLRYLNRLSDLLFVLARVLCRVEGGTEVLWDRGR